MRTGAEWSAAQELTTEEGLRPSNLEGVLLARANRSHGRIAIMYEQNIYIVANGHKRGYFGTAVLRVRQQSLSGPLDSASIRL